MFTPANMKKLTNVSIITLKKYNKTYSIPVYPNKLYEYHHNISPLSDCIPSTIIYKNVTTGIRCSKEDLSLFNLPVLDIIKYIILYGHEQKNILTREYELQMIENQIVDRVRKKIQKDGKFMRNEECRRVVKRVYNINMGSVKGQVLEIISVLEREGYEKVKMRVEVDGEEKFIDSGEYKKFKEECKEKKKEYIVKKNIQNNEESII
ncbi:ribosome biogenesis protein SBDS [Vairimorpha necatrix]|uniref:Ribosome biogenesis protein SBDS n=1 Tax=Vairimorpha necatrix TaxID=6039 RepID=A0AAX4JFU9_9MICR